MLFSWSGRLANPGDTCRGNVSPAIRFSRSATTTGQIRAFHNVCRHRGAAAPRRGAGHCGKLVVCPYHSWSYKRDGRLNKATDFGGDAHFDAGAWSLYAVDAEEWRGLVFIRAEARRPGPDRMARPDP